MDLELLKNELDKMNTDQLDELIQFIKDKKLLDDYETIILDALDAKYHDAFKCPICDSRHIKKNGFFNSREQKYYCHQCKRNFAATKGSILANTKLNPITWLKYIIAMKHEETLENCAEFANVSLRTSFFMRHKIGNALVHEMNNKESLEGIVELDELSVNISYSGNHKKQDPDKKIPREPYKRGRKKSRSKHKDEVTDSIQIASAIDRTGNIFLKVAKIGTTVLDTETMKDVYSNVLENASVLCTDGLFAYRELSSYCNLEHHAFKSNSKERRGVFHINNINYVHSRIRKYMRKHTGISSKYLNEYLAIIAYSIRYKSNDLHDDFVHFFKCECSFRCANYTGTPHVTI